jgi:hypothetical protein
VKNSVYLFADKARYDGYGKHPKHVEWSCNKIKIASCWTFCVYVHRKRCTEPWTKKKKNSLRAFSKILEKVKLKHHPCCFSSRGSGWVPCEIFAARSGNGTSSFPSTSVVLCYYTISAPYLYYAYICLSYYLIYYA